MQNGFTWTGNSLPSKKNSKKIITRRTKNGYRPSILSSDKYQVWELGFVRDIRTLEPIGSWKSAICIIYSPDNRKFDLSNKWESIADGMVAAGYIEDDNYVYIPEITLRYGGNTENKTWKVILEILA